MEGPPKLKTTDADKIVLYEEFQLRKEADAFLYDLNSRQKINLTKGKPNDSLKISPDYKLLAYLLSDQMYRSPDLLSISDANGNPVKAFSPEIYGKYTNIIQWVGNDQLLIGKFTKNSPYPVILLDWNSGNKKNIYMDSLGGSLDPGFYWWWDYVFSPSLSQVVYPIEERPVGATVYGMTLWDVKKWGKIASFPDLRFQGEKGNRTNNDYPVWSHNGEQFIFANPIRGALYDRAEIISISKDGVQKRWTNFTDFYPAVNIGNFSWSPDDRYVAFTLNRTSQETMEYSSKFDLAIIDVQTKKVTDYCIRVYPMKMFWSPDGTKLLVYESIDGANFRTDIIDLSEGKAFTITNDVYPIGWMIGEQ